MGMIWERVPGALVEAQGAPGDTLELALAVRYRVGRYELNWTGSAVADAGGIARVRVPYATEGPNGDGSAAGPAGWRFAGAEGRIRIPPRAVLERGLIRLDDR
jgi:hypothetical protein